MGHSLDELAPQTRRLLELIAEMVGQTCKRLDMERSDYHFTRREVREHSGWGPTQVRVHLERLVELEYVLVHHGGRGQQFVYELLFDGSSTGAAQLGGLAEIETLGREERAATPTSTNLAGPEGDLAGGWRGHGRPKTGGWRGGGNGNSGKPVADLSVVEGKPDGNAHLEGRPKPRSYTLHRSDSRPAARAKARPN
jgi:hypothetical protein